MELLAVGQEIPDLILFNQNNEACQLTALCAGTTLLYFYPKAMTSGCTTQACALRDGMAQLQALNVKVYGISPDKPEKLSQFIAKENLNFSLLSDNELIAGKAFGAYGPKKMYGREYLGMYRVSFLVQDGKIIANFPKVKPKEHLAMILKWLETNQTSL